MCQLHRSRKFYQATCEWFSVLTVGFLKSALEADAASVKMEVASEEQGENITIIAGLVPHWPSVWFFVWQSAQNASVSGASGAV